MSMTTSQRVTPGVIHCGDCLAILRTWPADCIDCIVTSPPYYGLRDYGTGEWQGGDPACDHKPNVKPRSSRPRGKLHTENEETAESREPTYRDTCPKCGATRIDQQLGLEPTMQEYIDKLVAVFREVRRKIGRAHV